MPLERLKCYAKSKSEKDSGRRGRGDYISISFPSALLLEVDRVIEELGYWPNRATFVREAIMQKLDRYKKEIEARKAEAEKLGEEKKT